MVVLPRGNDESVQVFVINAKKKPASVWVNPYTGSVLGVRTVAEQQQGLMLKLRGFHRNLLQGKNGSRVVGAVTILALFMSLTGLILWWPRKIVKLKTSASLSRINFDLHNMVGIFSSIMLLVLSVTGIAISYPQVGKLISSMDTAAPAEPAAAIPEGVAAPLSLDSLTIIAAGALPGTRAAAISLPQAKSAVLTMGRWYPDEPTSTNRSRLWMNAYTGEVLRIDDSKHPLPGHADRGSAFPCSCCTLASCTGGQALCSSFSAAWVRSCWWLPVCSFGSSGLSGRRAPAWFQRRRCSRCVSRCRATRRHKHPSDNAVRAVLRRRVDSGNVKGPIVGIIDRGGRQRIVPYGTSDVPGMALGERTVFELGSLTKTFTATILADMVLRGEVALDDPCRNTCPRR